LNKKRRFLAFLGENIFKNHNIGPSTYLRPTWHGQLTDGEVRHSKDCRDDPESFLFFSGGKIENLGSHTKPEGSDKMRNGFEK
jgi:hypothetical protein